MNSARITKLLLLAAFSLGSLPPAWSGGSEGGGSLPASLKAGGTDGAGSLPEAGDADGGGSLPALLRASGTDGAGGLPHAIDPGGSGGLPSPSGSHPAINGTRAVSVVAAVAGLVVAGPSQQPVAGVSVLVTNQHGDLVGAGITTEAGIFALWMSAASSLELAIPALGLAGLSVQPGQLLTIWAP